MLRDEHRKNPRGLAYLLLPYALIDDGILLQQDSSCWPPGPIGGGVGGDVVLELIDLCSSRRRDDILRGYRVHNVLRREAFGLKQSAIQIDHHFSLLAAVGIGHGDARNGHQLRPQEVQRQIIQIRLAKSWTGKCELENRHTGGGVVHN
jgi:hypothetical protein